MGPKKLVTIFALAAAITVAGIRASGAMTATKHFKAAVSLSRNDPFHGHVSSTFCHKSRTNDRPGRSWPCRIGAIDAHHVHGKFYARVVRVVSIGPTAPRPSAIRTAPPPTATSAASGTLYSRSPAAWRASVSWWGR